MSSGPDEQAVLSLRGITKRFGTTHALDDVSLDLARGTVHGLLGENGAGKTTLMRVAFGLIRADSGSVRIAGGLRQIESPLDAITAGVGMVHQHFTNVPAMTVAENVALGQRGLFRRTEAARLVREIGGRAGLTLDPDARAEALSVGAQQRLEIVKALARGARILILDEPTAVLAPSEAEELLRWLRRYADEGNAVVLITHKLREALSIADEITVLRHGRVVANAPANRLTTDSLTTALLGEEVSTLEPVSGSGTVGGEVARLVRVSVVDERNVSVVRDASIEIRSGEIVGVAGVEGSGQHQLLRVLSNRLDVTEGVTQLPDTIGFVPEDRHRDAIVLDLSLVENVALGGAGKRRGIVRWAVHRERTRQLVDAFDVRGASLNGPVRALSGGNQQKLVLARELDPLPALVVAENPTRGLDVRATQAVHDRLRAAANAGSAVVVYSSDLDEVLSLATRVLVIHDGSVHERPLDRDAVGRAMLGV